MAKKRTIGSTERGFTIVELMVASLVFSVILLLVAGTIVRFTNRFQKGVVESTTQNVARSIVDTIAQSIQFGKIASPVQTYGYCLGTTKYERKLATQLGSPGGTYSLLEKKGAGLGCGASGVSSQELLSERMRLLKFKIDRVPGTTQLWTIQVKVAYGDDDLLCSDAVSGSCDPGATALNIASLDPTNPTQLAQLEQLRCKAVQGSQFCAVRELTTTVKSL